MSHCLMGLYERYVTTFFQQKGRHPSSLSEMQRNALQSLRDDSSIVISKPDKGNGVVIMNKSDYQAKMLHILDDKTKFSRVKSDNNLSNLSRFQKTEQNRFILSHYKQHDLHIINIQHKLFTSICDWKAAKDREVIKSSSHPMSVKFI